MAEEINMSEVVQEIKGATEEELRQVIEVWYEKTRTDGLRIGAKMMSAAIYGIIQQHTQKKTKVSMNDYRRMTDAIIKLISVQLKEQSDSNEENVNDGTAE
jgi:hypothetical protein